jgi:hypothetical protein
MEITVSGLDHNSSQFVHLWGRYVLGVRPWKHCQHTFEVKHATSIKPKMQNGTFPLIAEHDLFYLCGVGQEDSMKRGSQWNREFTNIHLAVRPKLGSIATIESLYGVNFTITDAKKIPIECLPDNFMGLKREHARCKNFQFGFQMFDVQAVGDSAPHEIVRRLRSGLLAK